MLKFIMHYEYILTGHLNIVIFFSKVAFTSVLQARILTNGGEYTEWEIIIIQDPEYRNK